MTTKFNIKSVNIICSRFIICNIVLYIMIAFVASSLKHVIISAKRTGNEPLLEPILTNMMPYDVTKPQINKQLSSRDIGQCSWIGHRY